MQKIAKVVLFIIIFLVVIAATAWLASYFTKKYIEKKILEDLTFPIRYVKTHTQEINEKMCGDAKFLEYPTMHGMSGKASNNCYDYSFANFLSTLSENVSVTNCFEEEHIPLPKSFSEDYVVLKMPNKKAKYGYLFYSPMYRTTFLIWSGTITLQMWMEDFQAYPVSMPRTSLDENIRVHKGFLDIYESTRDTILESYDKNFKKKTDYFVIAGHSLGGGISPISAFDLSSQIKSKLLCYTFGAPRCGNRQFAEAYADKITTRKISSSLRIFNTEDIVPTIPLSSPKINYTHVGLPVAFTINLGSIVDNHIEAYLYYLPKKLTLIC